MFENQGHLTIPQQQMFAARFGELEIPDLRVSNVRKNGQVVGVDQIAFINLRANEGWHVDSTYHKHSAKAGILRSEVQPPSGGGQTGAIFI